MGGWRFQLHDRRGRQEKGGNWYQARECHQEIQNSDLLQLQLQTQFRYIADDGMVKFFFPCLATPLDQSDPRSFSVRLYYWHRQTACL
jgi:hypothetical protein